MPNQNWTEAWSVVEIVNNLSMNPSGTQLHMLGKRRDWLRNKPLTLHPLVPWRMSLHLAERARHVLCRHGIMPKRPAYMTKRDRQARSRETARCRWGLGRRLQELEMAEPGQWVAEKSWRYPKAQFMACFEGFSTQSPARHDPVRPCITTDPWQDEQSLSGSSTIWARPALISAVHLVLQ